MKYKIKVKENLTNNQLTIVILLLLLFSFLFFYLSKEFSNNNFISITTLLLGAVFTLVVNNILLSPYHATQNSIRVDKICEELLTTLEVIPRYQECGINCIFPDRDHNFKKNIEASITNEIENSENPKIKILGCACSDFFDPLGHFYHLFDNILNNKKKADITILMCNLSDHADERDLCEITKDKNGNTIPKNISTRGKINYSLQNIRHLNELNSNNKIKTVLYNQPPTAFVLITSDIIFVGPYNYGKPGCKMPIFQAKKDTPVYKSYTSHFDHLFKKWCDKNLWESWLKSNHSV
ncbi:MAG: hypothetical protein ACYDEJ_06590 [Desulfitobacteriaceae bacterium]